MTNRRRSATSSPLDLVAALLGRASVAVAVTGLVVVGLAHLDGARDPQVGTGPAAAVEVATAAATAVGAVEPATSTATGTGPAGPSPAAADAVWGVGGRGPKVVVAESAVVVDAAASGLPSRLVDGALPDPEPTPDGPAADPSVAPRRPTPEPAAPSASRPVAAPTSATEPAPERRTTAHEPEPAPEHIERIVRARFGDRTDAALRVAHCESRYDPRAVSAGGGSWGLFQINRVHEDLVTELGYEWEDLLDAAVNTHVARVLFDRAGGWSPWTCAWAAR